MRRRDLLLGLGCVALAPALPGPRAWRAAQAAATVTDPSDAGGAFAELLTLAPDVLRGLGAPLAQFAAFANPAAQLAALGLPPDTEAESGWLNATYWLTFPSGVQEFAREPRWRDAFGFAAPQIDLALEVGEPPAQVKLLRGRFDPDELRAAWRASGYDAVEVGGAEAWSWAEDGEIDFESDVSRYGVGSMNNAAILPDGTLLFARTLAGLRDATAAAAGDAPSLGERPEIAAFVAALDPAWATGFLLSPEAIRGPDPAAILAGASPDEANAVATALAEDVGELGEMPRPELVAVGVTAGGPLPTSAAPNATPVPLSPDTPTATGEIALRFSDASAAATAAEIVDTRLRTATSLVVRVPYRDLFPAWEIRIAPDAPILTVRLDAEPGSRPNRVVDLLLQRDLLFVAWGG